MRPAARLTVAGVLVAALAAAGCNGGPPREAASDPAASPEARLDGLTALDARVAAVSWSLAKANADLCPVSRQRAGWTLQSASQYGAELRPLAERRFGLDGDLPGILVAPAGSPAAKAGLAPGDLIVAVNGQPLAAGAGATESYEGLKANIAVVDGALARGPAQLTVRRAGVERAVHLRPELACAYGTQVDISDSARSRFDGRFVFITNTMALLAGNDDELAFALGHELAHGVLEHRTQADVTGVKGASNWAISMRRGLSLSAEADADKMAVYLVARAGFDPYQGIEFLTRLEESNPALRSPQVNMGGVYEGTSARRRALQPTLAEVTARKTDGRPLIP